MKRTLRYGGELEIGDFIAVSDGNYLSFGWYCGDGRGTLQYYSLNNVYHTIKKYEEYLITPLDKRASWQDKSYAKGFTLKHFYKCYINSVHDTRVMKLTNVEDVFTDQEDREKYEIGRAKLIELNFIKQ